MAATSQGRPRPQKDIDTIGSSHVADGIVCWLGVFRGNHWGERIGQWCTQSHKWDSSDTIFQADQATKDSGHITDDGSENGNDEERNEEG